MFVIRERLYADPYNELEIHLSVAEHRDSLSKPFDSFFFFLSYRCKILTWKLVVLTDISSFPQSLKIPGWYLEAAQDSVLPHTLPFIVY